MKRLLSILMLLAMLMSVLVACGTSGDNPSNTPADTTPASGGGNETPAETTEETEYLEAKDLQGYAFRFLGGMRSKGINYKEEDIDQNSIMSQAKFTRNAEIKDKFNIVYEDVILPDTDYIANYVIKDVLTNAESSFDIGELYTNERAAPMITNDAAYDINDMPVLDTTQPWYGQQANQEYSFLGKQYFVVGMFPNLSGTCDFVFNKDLMAELNLELPYQIMFDGKWTFEKMNEYIAVGYNDIDGIAGPSGGDQFGYSGHSFSISYFYQGVGGKTTTRDENDALVPVITDDTVNALYEKIYDFYRNPNVWVNDNNAVDIVDGGHAVFYQGRSLFCYWVTGTAYPQDIDTFEYGLGILPKYDLDQEDYCCPGLGGIVMFPTNLGNAETTGLIYEALCEASYRHTYPASIQEAVKFEKYTDEESIEMKKFVDKHLTFDILKICDPSNGDLASCAFINFCLKNNTTPAIAGPAAKEGYEKLFYDFCYPNK